MVKLAYVCSEIQQAGFTDRLKVDWEQVVKGNSRAFGVSRWKGGGPIC